MSDKRVTTKGARSKPKEKNHPDIQTMVINKRNFNHVLNLMDSGTEKSIEIEKGSNFDSDQKKKLIEVIDAKGIVIVMRDCKAGDLSDYAAVSPEGKCVLVERSIRGRTQYVTLLDEYVDRKPPSEPNIGDSPTNSAHGAEEDKFSSDEYSSSSAEEDESSSSEEDESSSAEEDESSSTVEDESSSAEEDESSSAEEDESSSAEDAEQVENGTAENQGNAMSEAISAINRLVRSNVSDDKQKWKQFVKLEYMRYSSNIYALQKKLRKVTEKKGHSTAFFTLDIEIYATNIPENKYIKFTLTDACGMKSSMAIDSGKYRGFFNHSASVYIFPESRDKDPENSQLPINWSRPRFEPQGSNLTGTYTHRTGWGVDFSVGGQVGATGPMPTGSANAGVTFSRNSSKASTCTIPKFAVRSESDDYMTGWKFYYTDASEENLLRHFDDKGNIKPVADLARGTLTLKSECVYMGPADYVDKMEWNILFQPTFALLRKPDPKYRRVLPSVTKEDTELRLLLRPKSFAITTMIDMGVVECYSPGNGDSVPG